LPVLKLPNLPAALALPGLMLMLTFTRHILHRQDNMHGMPLSASIGEDNEESKVHEPDEKTKKQWDQLKNLGKDMP